MDDILCVDVELEQTARELFIRKNRRAELDDEMQTDFFEEDEYGPTLPTREAAHLVPIEPGACTLQGDIEKPEPYYEEVLERAECSTHRYKLREYRGFTTLPDLKTEAGRAEFYGKEDRGVASEEDAFNYRPCAPKFVKSLFEDYLNAFVEKILGESAIVRQRGLLVHQATQYEFDRLQHSHELFESSSEFRSFRKRLVEVYLAQRKLEKTMPSCLRIMRQDTKNERLVDESYARPSTKSWLPAWTQFLGNQSPGVPEHMAVLYDPLNGRRSQVLPPCALALRRQWVVISEIFERAYKFTPEEDLKAEWWMNQWEEGSMENEGDFGPVDEVEKDYEGPISLPAVNKYATSLLAQVPFEPDEELADINFEVSYRFKQRWGCIGEIGPYHVA